jgi:hypothetical protein
MDLLPNLEIEPALDDMRSDEELTQEAVDSVEDAERPISPFVRPPNNKTAEAEETLAEPTFSASRRKKVVSDKQRAHLDRIRVLAHEKRRAKAAEKKAAKEADKAAKRETAREEKLLRRREKHATKDFERFMGHMEAFSKLQHDHKVKVASEKVKAAAAATSLASSPAKEQPKQSSGVKLVDPAPYNAYDSWFG